MNISQKDEFRYWFAGLALQGILSNNTYMQKKCLELRDMGLGEHDAEKYIVVDAVDCADALIAELQRTEVRK